MSKGLEAFKTTVDMFNQYANKPDDIGEFFRYTLSCSKVEKELKALEVIKEKNVNVRAFKKVLPMEQNDDVKLRVYNSQNDKDEDDLTKEEFDLLKKVLE